MRASVSPVLAALLLVGWASPVGGQEEPLRHARLYLMSSDAHYLYWTVDPEDPELDAARAIRPTDSMNFLPASRLAEPVSWGPADPLRFHLALEVSTSTPRAYTVHLTLWTPGRTVQSPPADQVAPGIWEGRLAAGSLDPASPVLLVVEVQADTGPGLWMDLRTGGRSYVELPTPVAATGVPSLMAQSTYRPQPTSFATLSREFQFNDADWSVDTFEGDLSAERSFSFELERDAKILIVWVEAYDTPFLYDVLRGRPTDVRELTGDAPRFVLSRAGQTLLARDNARGVGVVSGAAMDVPAGPLTLTVRILIGSMGHPYRAHVLAVHGERTLRAMRWRYHHGTGDRSARTPVASVCPGELQPVPIPPEATTFLVDLDWDSASAGVAPQWTVGFALPGFGDFPCGELGRGDRLRFTMPLEGVRQISATPAGGYFVNLDDTVFDLEVRYAYTPGAA